MNRVLFIGAHPDDIELGCAGTIYKYSNMGWTIGALILAEGSSSRYDDPITSRQLIDKDKKDRKESCKRSLTNLGVSSFKFHDLPCSKLDTVPMLTINKMIEAEIREFNPEVVFTHSQVDTNKDHKLVFESTKIATRPSAFPQIRSIYCYEVLSSTECSYSDVFKPNYFVSLSREHLEKKIESLKFYETEMKKFPNSRSAEGVEVLAKFRGIQINKNYAESFETLRSCA